MNPLLQIMSADPEVVVSEAANINNNPITGIAADDTEYAAIFEDLLVGTQANETNIDVSTDNQTPNNNIDLQYIYNSPAIGIEVGYGKPAVKLKDLLTGIQPDETRTDEPTDNQSSNKNVGLHLIQNSNAGAVLFNDASKLVGNSANQIMEDNPVSQAEYSPIIVDEVKSLPQLHLNPDAELQRLLANTRPDLPKAVPVDLLSKQSPESGKNIIFGAGKAETADILYRTNIPIPARTDPPPVDDIFNQKLNVLNLRRVDLIENNPITAVKSDAAHKLSGEKTEIKSLFDIPTLTRPVRVETTSEEGNKTKVTSNIQAVASTKEESTTTAAMVRPAEASTGNSSDGKTGDLPANNSESGKESGGPPVKSNAGQFAKTPGGEILTTHANSVAKTTSTPSQSNNAAVRFIIPDKLLESGSQNNRTIMIKMEPEHLGTIRLTLSSAHHGLTGRMVVDNATTHAIVQSNIDHLFTELSDKGIKLDAFSISVGVDGGNEKSTQERRPFRMNNRGGIERNISGLELIKPAAIEMRSNSMYINSNGVNWLA